MADYITELNRREVKITRFATYLLNEYAYPSLDAAFKSARAILLSESDIKSRSKLTALEREVRKAIKAPYTASMAELSKELEEFAIDESKVSATFLEEASGKPITAPPAESVIKLATTEYMTLETAATAVSAPYQSFIAANADQMVKSVANQIAAGFSKNESNKEIVKRLRSLFSGLLKNHAETLVRTGTAFYAQQARNAMRNDNMDIIEREVPIVTFDNRTSFTCMSLADRYPKGWKVGQSPVGYPPYHYGCRTVIGYWTSDDVDLEGERASVGGSHAKDATEAAEDGKLSFRKRKDKDYFDPKPIPANTPFAKFLKSQPRWYIEQQLQSKKLADDFINGKINLADLTDKDLKPLSRKQINEG